MVVYLIEQNMYRDVSYPIYKILEVVVDDPSIDLEELSRNVSITGEAEVTVLEGNSLYVPIRGRTSEDKFLKNLDSQNVSCQIREIYNSQDRETLLLKTIDVYKFSQSEDAISLKSSSLVFSYKPRSDINEWIKLSIPRSYLRKDSLYYYVKSDSLDKILRDKKDDLPSFNPDRFLDYFNIYVEELSQRGYYNLEKV